MNRTYLIDLFRTYILIGLTSVALLFSPQLQPVNAQGITAGDVLLIDFGKSGQETTGNWNNVANSEFDGENLLEFEGIGELQFELADDLIRFSDGSATGVSLSMIGSADTQIGIDLVDIISVGAEASFSSSGTIPDSAQIDLLFADQPTSMLTFSNLSAGTYNVEILSKSDVDLNIGIGGVAIGIGVTDPPLVTAYEGLMVDGSGDLIIDLLTASGGANLQHINAIELTAVSLALEPDMHGDFNDDGIVNCEDLTFYVGMLGESADGELAELDLDADGQVTIDDADLHITTMLETSNGQVGTFPGDVDCSGSVDIFGDAFALIANLGGAATRYSQGDINFDENVDVLKDAFILVANLGATNEPTE